MRVEAAGDKAVNAQNSLDAALEAARQINATVDALTARKVELQEQIDLLTQRNLTLWRLPLKREELLDLMLDSIDRLGSEFLASNELKAVFRAFAFPGGQRAPTTGPLSLQPHQQRQQSTAVNLQDLLALNGSHPRSLALERVLGLPPGLGLLGGASADGSVDHRSLCFFFGDVIKEKIRKHFEQLCPDLGKGSAIGQQDGAPSVAQRREEIAANEDRIGQLEADALKVVEQLAKIAAVRGGSHPAPSAHL